MSPSNLKMNTSESSRPRSRKTSTHRRSLGPQKPQAIKQRKIPKPLHGVPLYIYGAKWKDFMNGDGIIQPLVMPESAPSCAHDTIPSPQDTAVNMASSHFPSDDFVQSQIPASAQVYFEAEPSHVPFSFQYDLDFNSQALAEDVFSLTCDPYHFLPPSSSTQSGRLSMEHRVEPHQQWLRMDPNIPIIPQTILSYASSTYTGNSDNDIFAEITGSSHLTPPNDGTFPTYDANSYYM